MLFRGLALHGGQWVGPTALWKLPAQPGTANVTEAAVPPPQHCCVRADISELTGQALLGTGTHLVSFAFIRSQNRKCMPHFSK